MESSESTPLWPDTPEEFCAALKTARLRRGLTLAEISQQTKITESHFVALERADLRHWPKGIFRRAFFSDYVRAVGLPVDPTVAAFARLFPDPAPAPHAAVIERSMQSIQQRVRHAGGEMRLAFAHGSWIPPGAASRARLAAADAVVVVATAGAGAWIVEGELAAAVAIVALSYYSLAVVMGRPHPGPALIRRAVQLMPGVQRRRSEWPAPRFAALRPAITSWRGVRAAVVTELKALLAKVRASLRMPERWRSVDLRRVTAIDLQRLKDATPRVLDRLRRGSNREGSDRPMARPRPDSPRHMRRRQEQSGDAGVRVRIRLTRRER